jgi:hypothetical protein
MFIKLLAGALVASAPAIAVADFYKCTAPDGKITYSDKRCVTTTTVVHSPSATRGSGFIVPASGQVADNPAGVQQLQNLAHSPRNSRTVDPVALK